MKNIGVLIYTYNRVDDAKINMDIVRNVWEGTKHFEDIKIVHSFNGSKEWYSKKYLEDDLVAIKNSWHFQGASDLIDAGIKVFQKKHKTINYVVVLASDTWLIKPAYLKGILDNMRKNNLYMATCSWGLPGKKEIRDVGMAVDFFVVDLKWATRYKMFPIDYAGFYEKYGEIILYQKGGNILLEKLLYARYLKAVSREEKFGGVARKKAIEKLLYLKDREPVHGYVDKEGSWIRNMYWPKIGLLSHHGPAPKKKILKENDIRVGKSIEKLLRSGDLSYYNGGIKRMEHNCN